jgi:hypothetical protein
VHSHDFRTRIAVLTAILLSGQFHSLCLHFVAHETEGIRRELH